MKIKIKKKYLFLACVLTVCLSLVVVMSCLSVPDFNEELWLERVNAVDPQLLYAENKDKKGVFFNPWMPTSGEKNNGRMFRYMFSKKMSFPDFNAERYKHVDNQYDYLTDPQFNSISYAGHASLFIKIDGSTIITDPFFSDYAGTVGKQVRVNVDFSKIPERAVVLISHNHYDHLNAWTIDRLIKRNAIFIVPQGLKEFFVKRGAVEVHELNWWQDVSINSIKYTFLPAQHWSMRLGVKRNGSLWGGFMIEASKTIYFSGDTGYFIGFKEFGNRFKIDYAIIGAGAYEPRWFMAYQHLNVAEFFLAADDLKAAIAIPMHFGIISLSAEPLLYPLFEIDLFIQENPKYSGRVRALRVGEFIGIP